MVQLLYPAAVAVAAVAIASGLLELRTAWRFFRLKSRADASEGEPYEVVADIAVPDPLIAPVSGKPAALYTLLLIRSDIHERRRSAQVFTEEHPFDVVERGDDGGPRRRHRIESKKRPVVLFGLPSLERPLPFLPTGVAALLIQRFGRFGQQWAEGYAITAREAVLEDGARVYVLIDGGQVQTVSPRPLRAVGRSAARRGMMALALALGAAIVAIILK